MKKIHNIETYISNVEELNFSTFYKERKKNPRIFQLQMEEKMRNLLETKKQVCALNSGTAAIHLALKLSNLEPNDIVFCSSATFIASVNPILYEKAEPYFIDVDKQTGNMSPMYLENAILKCLSTNKKPKAIIVTHSYGMPAEMDELLRIKDKYKLTLIEDAAEALGSSYRNEFCGTLADYGIISFNTNKLCSTLGGGVLIVNNLEEKEKVKSLASQAKITGIEFMHREVGYNYLMNDMAAYLGLHQLDFLNKEIQLKESINTMYNKEISKLKNVHMLFSDDRNKIRSNKWMNCISFINEDQKNTALDNFLKNKIEVRGFWYPLQSQKFLKQYSYEGENESTKLYQRTLCLPSSINLTKNDIRRIVNVLKMSC